LVWISQKAFFTESMEGQLGQTGPIMVNDPFPHDCSVAGKHTPLMVCRAPIDPDTPLGEADRCGEQPSGWPDSAHVGDDQLWF
jgi:hypothetical protein